MDRFQDRAAVLGRSLTVLTAYAVIVGGLSLVINLGAAFDGVSPAIGRAVIGVVGLAAGTLLWTGRRVGIDGWHAVMLWSLLQIPFYAWNTEGSPTVQLLEFPLSASSTSIVNGEVTSYSEIGINVIGVILAFWVARTRERWERRAGPAVAAL